MNNFKFAVVMKIEDNRAAKFSEFETYDDALAHAAVHAERWPDAFIIEHPGVSSQLWYFEGDKVSIVAPVPLVPISISRRRFKMQLAKQGLLETVEAWVASQGQLVQIAYEESGDFVRDEPMMQAGFSALGFSTAQIDEFFTAASRL